MSDSQSELLKENNLLNYICNGIIKEKKMLTFATIFGVEIMKLIRSRSGSSLINQIDNGTIASRKGDASGPNLGIFLNIRSSGMNLNTRIVLEDPALRVN